jgi:predicted small secreted protein
MKRIALLAATLALAAGLLTGCGDSDADVASKNLSKAAEQFEVFRRIVFFNGITDKYLLVIEGRCSVETSDSALGGSLEVTCKLPNGKFKKAFLGLSDNVSYLVEQPEGVEVSTSRYRVIFKPEAIVPNFDRP